MKNVKNYRFKRFEATIMSGWTIFRFVLRTPCGDNVYRNSIYVAIS